MSEGIITRRIKTPNPFLLDNFGGAAAAYSLRLLSANEFGNPVVKVRRDSDNAEQDFTASEINDGSLVAWVGNTASDNGFVTTWYDQSGNGNDATQSTAASQPKIVSGGSLVTENSKPAIDFDGNDDFVESSSSTLADVFTSSFMLCMVSKADNIQPLSTSGQNKRIIHAFDSGNTLQLVINESSLDKVSSDAGDVSATNGTFFKLQQTLFVAEMEQDKIFIDGVDSGTGTTAAGNPNPNGTGTRIGADKAGSGVNGEYDGTIQEIIIYDSDQSSNRTGIESNINNHYGIY